MRTLVLLVCVMVSGAIGAARAAAVAGSFSADGFSADGVSANGASADSISADAAAAEKYYGTWSGTWDGAGTGTFELVLEKNKEGAPGGRVSVTGEPAYKATLKALAFDGQKMTAVYNFPPDDRAEVALAATFDGATAKGTWTVRGKDGGAEIASGGWSVKKQ